ncbi:hypothetical protein THRCLA_01144 [Thraustotheca clavata]|uniref:non-specific serine/threonine protein kinase n=1 Tax=Thraustotheca clavata TaxID=74557 RepID=A0A1W0A9C9_9STRA|nr:hypothetical protein THRCLA_01144 [Thraustotheca clavata]
MVASKKSKLRKVPVGPPPIKSRRRARAITTEFHRVTHELTKLQGLKDEDAKARQVELEQRLQNLGGRQVYQDASILSTSFHKTSKWVFSLLTKFGLRPAKKQPPLSVLEVGAINTQLLVCPWLDVQAIDLIARHPRIQQIDYFDYPFTKTFDVVVSSMVINCVPTHEKRGDMLQRTWRHLNPNGHFFLMLPLLCLTNSNYMTVERFEEIVKYIGFDIREKKESPKIAFYCLQKTTPPSSIKPSSFPHTMLRPGPKRNDFRRSSNENESRGGGGDEAAGVPFGRVSSCQSVMMAARVWRLVVAMTTILTGAVNADGCTVSKTTLTARCGFVVSSPDLTRICPYDPSTCKPITKTDTCGMNDGVLYSNITQYTWVCSYDPSRCENAGGNNYSDTFNKVYNNNQDTFKSSVFFNNAKIIQETGIYCYDSNKKELGVVALASSRHCIYDSNCNVSPFTTTTKSIEVVNDYFTLNSSVILNGLGIGSLGSDLSMDFNKANAYSNLELTNNRLTDISGTQFPESLGVIDVSENNLTSIAKVQATGLNALRASSNAITNIDTLPSALWSLVLESNLITALNASNLPPQLLSINLYNNKIASIQGSFPKTLNILILSCNKLTSFPSGALNAKLQQMDLSYNQLTAMPSIGELEKLKSIKLNNNAISTLSALPINVTTLSLAYNKLSTFPTTLPGTIQTLDLSVNTMTWDSSSPFPANITSLNMSGNPINNGFLNASLLPLNLQMLDLSSCKISSIVGDFPSQLTSLHLSDNDIVSFPLSGNTMILFKTIPHGLYLPDKISNLNCSSSSLVSIVAANKTVQFCPEAGANINPSKAWYFGIGAGVVLVVIIGVIILYRKRLVRSRALSKLLEDFASNRSRHSKHDSMTGFEFQAADQIPGVPGESRAGISAFEMSLSLGELEDHRIPLSDVKILGPLHGKHKNASVPGTMMTYKAEFDGRIVVLKTLMTDTNMHNPTLSQTANTVAAGNNLRVQAEEFVNVIRLLARLEHPNIVAFIGAVWSSNLRRGMLGFGFITEHMENGDLERLLNQDKTKSSSEKLLQWTPRNAKNVPKLSIVSDIALAIVCLHSFAPAIIHRNIHSRHVLLSKDYVAKLSGFHPEDNEDGNHVSSFVPDRLLTAPEVLKGEKWTEKADIYSFGILICEVDLGYHPYANTIKGGNAEDNSKQIATLVMADLLQPTFSVECPIDVQDVAKKCLSHNADERPSAVQMEYWLRKLRSTTHGTTVASSDQLRPCESLPIRSIHLVILFFSMEYPSLDLSQAELEKHYRKTSVFAKEAMTTASQFQQNRNIVLQQGYKMTMEKHGYQCYQRANPTSSFEEFFIVGGCDTTLDDLNYALYTTTTHSQRCVLSLLYKWDFLDGAILQTEQVKTDDDPFQWFGIKYARLHLPLPVHTVFQPRDTVYAEQSGTRYDANGNRTLFQVRHTITTPAFPPFPHIVRFYYQLAFIFTELPNGSVQFTIIGHLDPQGNMPAWIYNKRTSQKYYENVTILSEIAQMRRLMESPRVRSVRAKDKTTQKCATCPSFSNRWCFCRTCGQVTCMKCVVLIPQPLQNVRPMGRFSHLASTSDFNKHVGHPIIKATYCKTCFTSARQRTPRLSGGTITSSSGREGVSHRALSTPSIFDLEEATRPSSCTHASSSQMERSLAYSMEIDSPLSELSSASGKVRSLSAYGWDIPSENMLRTKSDPTNNLVGGSFDKSTYLATSDPSRGFDPALFESLQYQRHLVEEMQLSLAAHHKSHSDRGVRSVS